MKIKLVLVLAALLVVGCEAFREVVEEVVGEAVESIQETIQSEEPAGGEDPGEIDFALRAACCFAPDSEIAFQIESLEALKADDFGFLEALQRVEENCNDLTEDDLPDDDSSDDDSLLELLKLCCETCGIAVGNHVYGVVP